MGEKIWIVTDSAADLTKEELQKEKITLVGMTINCAEETFIDDGNLDDSIIWAKIIAGENYKTAQPAPADYAAKFSAAKEQGAQVVCICLSSALSGTYQSAQMAKEMLGGEGVYVIDSLSAVAAQKILVLEACRLRTAGKSAQEIAEALEELKGRLGVYACIDTLDYLVRGGRLSKTSAALGQVLNIKPLVTLTTAGRLEVYQKARGLKKAIGLLNEALAHDGIDTAYPVIPLYVQDQTNCELLKEAILADKDLGVQEFAPNNAISLTVGCHIGPGGFGVAFVKKKNMPRKNHLA